MKLPPLLARVRFGSVTLWLPLILLWPLGFMLIPPLLLVGAIGALLIPGLSLRELGRLCGGLYLVLCELRGTLVSVEARQAHIAFTLY